MTTLQVATGHADVCTSVVMADADDDDDDDDTDGSDFADTLGEILGASESSIAMGQNIRARHALY